MTQDALACDNPPFNPEHVAIATAKLPVSISTLTFKVLLPNLLNGPLLQ